MNITLLDIVYTYFGCGSFCTIVFWMQLAFEAFRDEEQQSGYLELKNKLKGKSFAFTVYILSVSSIFVFSFWPLVQIMSNMNRSKKA